MFEFLRKFESHGIKIARVTSIRITKSINLRYWYDVGLRYDRGRFSVQRPFIEKSMVQHISN